VTKHNKQKKHRHETSQTKD